MSQKVSESKKKSQLISCYSFKETPDESFDAFNSHMQAKPINPNISLQYCPINLRRMRIFCKRLSKHLQSLFLKQNWLKSDLVNQFVKYKWEKLTLLCIQDNEINDISLALILQGEFPQLQYLIFERNGLTSGLKGVENSRLLKLKFLSLVDNKIGSKGVKNLIKANFPQLNQIQINPPLQVQGMKYLAKSCWPSLKTMSLQCLHSNLDGFSYLYLLKSSTDTKLVKRLPDEKMLLMSIVSSQFDYSPALLIGKILYKISTRNILWRFDKSSPQLDDMIDY